VSATFLLELLTEEIPTNALPSTRQQLADGLRQQLEAAHLSGFSITVFSTSRRLVVRIARLPLRQPDREERLLGPPKSVAFAADGTPTRAAEGFARKAGVALEQLEVEATPKGEYLAVTVTHPGRPTAAVLAEAVPAAMSTLRFPKTMRWGQGEHTFVRPLHSVVALLDAEVVPLSLFGVAAGRRTVGHRVHAPKPFSVSSATAYFKQLERRAVVSDPAARRKHLEEAATALPRSATVTRRARRASRPAARRL
jgi:glycyl-tRNA synthetase beta chain